MEKDIHQKHQLSNGLKIVVSPMPQMASVSLGIWIGVGGRYESEKHSGISHVVEHMLFKGTQKRSAKDLKQAIEGIGGMLNGFTADEATCYMMKVPADHLALGFDTLTDMVFNSKFDEGEIKKEKSVICEEIKMYKDQPAERVIEILNKIMWPGDPLGRPLTGTISTVKSFKRSELIDFCRKNYSPSNMAVIAAGKVDMKSIVDNLSDEFKSEKREKPVFASPTLSQKEAAAAFSGDDTSQTHIAMGFHTDSKTMGERYALKILNVILGGNMSSRLFEELREKYGLCYDIASSYKRHSDVGEFVVHAGVDNKNAYRSVMAVLDELRKIRDIGITDDELKRAKEYLNGQFLLTMESTSARMLWCGDRLITDGTIPSTEELLSKVESVTKEEVKRMCEKFFVSSNLNLAIIGDLGQKTKSSIRKEIAKL